MSAALQMLAACPTAWGGPALRSPVSGQLLSQDGPNRLVADGEVWPVVDGIPFLRADRPGLVAAALAAIGAGALDEAAACLIADRDAAATGPACLPQSRALVAQREQTSLREAMRALGYGPLGDEFAHRWSDPGFLAGLALAEAYWLPRARVLEIGCGVGHFLRAFLRASTAVVGADRRFSHLWLARHWVAPTAELVCFDPAARWPFADAAMDVVFGHGVPDAGTDRPAVAAEMRRTVGREGVILCGHLRRAPGAAGADASPLADHAALFGRATLFDETELTAALIGRRAPRARPAASLAEAHAVAFAAGGAAGRAPAPVLGLLDAPPRGAALRRNPLYCEQDDGICIRRFPSALYAEAYGLRATYPPHVAARARVIAGADPGDDALIRRRVWLDLPPRW